MLYTDDLKVLELEGVSVTAAVEADGTLRPVSGLWVKLGVQAMELAHRRLLQTVVVAEEQNDVPPEYLREDAEPLRFIKAKRVADAVRQLNEQSLPRRAVRRHEREECKHLDILGRPVPIEDHYQALPLLREVKPEQLPGGAASLGDKQPAEQVGLMSWRVQGKVQAFRKEREIYGGRQPSEQADFVRWEEQVLRKERVTYNRYALNEVLVHFRKVVKDAKGDVPRFVVLGPPGSGKTTLVQYLAWLAANGDLRVLGRQLIPACLRLREWESWAVKPVDPEISLPEYLAECHKDLNPAPTADGWRQWLRRGEVLLLLDGLDEIGGNSSFKVALKNALTTFEDCPTVLTCRTVSYEQHRELCHGFPVFIMGWLEDKQRDASIRAFPAEQKERFNPDALIDQLNCTPQMHPLAANPLLLSIICYVVDDPQGVTLPSTSAELYDKAVEKLLTRAEMTASPDKRNLPLIRKRRILQRAARTLFAATQERRQLTFDEGSLMDALTQAAEQEGYQADAAPVADAILADSLKCGILRGSATQRYFFLHPTFHEFLTASALAREFTSVPQHQWIEEIRAVVDKREWEEVICLLSGLLPREGGDLLVHIVLGDQPWNVESLRARLAPENLKDAIKSLGILPSQAASNLLRPIFLAARCVSEGARVSNEVHAEVLKNLFDFWRSDIRVDIPASDLAEDAVLRAVRTDPTLLPEAVATLEEEIPDLFGRRKRYPSNVRGSAVWMLGQLGWKSCYPLLIQALDEEGLACTAVRAIGATKDDSLVEALRATLIRRVQDLSEYLHEYAPYMSDPDMLSGYEMCYQTVFGFAVTVFWTLAAMGGPQAREYLQRLARKVNPPDLRSEAKDALRALKTGKDLGSVIL